MNWPRINWDCKTTGKKYAIQNKQDKITVSYKQMTDMPTKSMT